MMKLSGENFIRLDLFERFAPVLNPLASKHDAQKIFASLVALTRAQAEAEADSKKGGDDSKDERDIMKSSAASQKTGSSPSIRRSSLVQSLDNFMNKTTEIAPNPNDTDEQNVGSKEGVGGEFIEVVREDEKAVVRGVDSHTFLSYVNQLKRSHRVDQSWPTFHRDYEFSHDDELLVTTLITLTTLFILLDNPLMTIQ